MVDVISITMDMAIEHCTLPSSPWSKYPYMVGQRPAVAKSLRRAPPSQTPAATDNCTSDIVREGHECFKRAFWVGSRSLLYSMFLDIAASSSNRANEVKRAGTRCIISVKRWVTSTIADQATSLVNYLLTTWNTKTLLGSWFLVQFTLDFYAILRF